MCSEGNDSGLPWGFTRSPTGRPRKEEKGRQREHIIMPQAHGFCLLSTYHRGTTPPSPPAVLTGLPLRHQSKQGQSQSDNFPERDVRMLIESSNISTGTAKLTRDSRTLMATSSNSEKTFICRRNEWSQPTEGRRGRDKGQRQT